MPMLSGVHLELHPMQYSTVYCASMIFVTVVAHVGRQAEQHSQCECQACIAAGHVNGMLDYVLLAQGRRCIYA
jgi:hypothetical protein